MGSSWRTLTSLGLSVLPWSVTLLGIKLCVHFSNKNLSAYPGTLCHNSKKGAGLRPPQEDHWQQIGRRQSSCNAVSGIGIRWAGQAQDGRRIGHSWGSLASCRARDTPGMGTGEPWPLGRVLL